DYFLSFGRPSLLADRNPRADETQHVLVEAHLALEFLHPGGLGRNIKDRVRPFALLADVVREPALSPVVDFGDIGAERLELFAELFEQRGDFLLGRARTDDHEDFIRSQFSLTSLALEPHRPEVRPQTYQTSQHGARATPTKRHRPLLFSAPG